MRRPMTSTIGVMQFVVQLAQEMMAGRASRHVRAMDDRLHLFTFRRRRQEDDPCAGADVLLEILAPRERPGALEHELDAQLLPGELRWVAAAQRPQLAAGDDQIASVDDHGLRVPPVHRVEAKQVGEVLDVDQVVDGDQLERRLVDHQLQDRASDSSQTVDGDFVLIRTPTFVSVRSGAPRSFTVASLLCLVAAIVSSAKAE